MLVNEQNQVVMVSEKLNSKTHPQIFAKLHEKHEPRDFTGGMFKLELRAKVK